MENDKSAQTPGSPSAVDFLSPRFDALAALYCEGLEPPNPNVKPLDNLSRCGSILPPELPESTARASKRTTSVEAKEKAQFFKNRALKVQQAADEEASRSAMQQIMSAVKPGPLALLKQWHQSGCKVQVVTRHCCGVRGKAEGFIVAYDRFMNLILQDVDEVYTVMVKVPRVKQIASTAAEGTPPHNCATAAEASIDHAHKVKHALSGASNEVQAPSSLHGTRTNLQDSSSVPTGTVEKIRWCRKQEKRVRHLHQVLLRGDNIVSVSCMPATTSASRPAAAGQKM